MIFCTCYLLPSCYPHYRLPILSFTPIIYTLFSPFNKIAISQNVEDTTNKILLTIYTKHYSSIKLYKFYYEFTTSRLIHNTEHMYVEMYNRSVTTHKKMKKKFFSLEKQLKIQLLRIQNYDDFSKF